MSLIIKRVGRIEELFLASREEDNGVETRDHPCINHHPLNLLSILFISLGSFFLSLCKKMSSIPLLHIYWQRKEKKNYPPCCSLQENSPYLELRCCRYGTLLLSCLLSSSRSLKTQGFIIIALRGGSWWWPSLDSLEWNWPFLIACQKKLFFSFSFWRERECLDVKSFQVILSQFWQVRKCLSLFISFNFITSSHTFQPRKAAYQPTIYARNLKIFERWNERIVEPNSWEVKSSIIHYFSMNDDLK